MRSVGVVGSVLLALGVTMVQAQGMQSLSDDQLGGIVGQEGVLLSFEYYYNSDPSTGGRSAANCGALATGQDADLSGLNCRFTWQIAGREHGKNHSGLTSAAGEWLVYKDGYLSLKTTRLSLDAAFLGGAGSSASAFESFYLPSRFEDSDGNCLLEGVSNCSNTSVALDALRNMPAMRSHYPATSGSYNPATRTATGYEDTQIGLRIGGLAVEYGSDASNPYLQNANGSFMGLTLSDNNRAMAGIAFGGSFYLYGF